jgi:hypothetical protein
LNPVVIRLLLGSALSASFRCVVWIWSRVLVRQRARNVSHVFTALTRNLVLSEKFRNEILECTLRVRKHKFTSSTPVVSCAESPNIARRFLLASQTTRLRRRNQKQAFGEWCAPVFNVLNISARTHEIDVVGGVTRTEGSTQSFRRQSRGCKRPIVVIRELQNNVVRTADDETPRTERQAVAESKFNAPFGDTRCALDSRFAHHGRDGIDEL